MDDTDVAHKRDIYEACYVDHQKAVAALDLAKHRLSEADMLCQTAQAALLLAQGKYEASLRYRAKNESKS